MSSFISIAENFYGALPGSGGLLSFFVCLVIVQTKGWHGKRTLDFTDGVQKFHANPTPRIGGVGIFTGLLVSLVFLRQETQELLNVLLIAALPAFAAGLLEDFTKQVSPRERLLAAMVSGVIACYLSGVSLKSIDLPLVDTWLAVPLLSLGFTAFAVAGVANAINIIDGFNGLASGVVIIILVALGGIAQGAGDVALAHAAWAIAGVTVGFFVLNFPFGKIFLGDGGAYCLGFLLAMVAVLLPERNPDVSPWASLVACAYPILEVLYSIFRRRKAGMAVGQPDNEHLHTLIKTRFLRKRFGYLPLGWRNAMVSPFAWLFALIPVLVAAHWAKEPPSLMLAFVVLAIVYVVTYWSLHRIKE